VPRPLLPVLFLVLLAGCVGVPDGLEPVRDFEAERYLGTWYEIARLDHRFERGLTDVTATYGRREDGGLSVLNRGWDADAGAFEAIEGRAYFVESADVGHLKVSFFGPFYGGYVVLAVDEAYEHALVSGPTRDYLWILARHPEPDPATVAAYRAQAAEAGFDVEALIRVAHERAPETAGR
jgi:apolipoprotein D and lipocalin family protein